MSLPFRFHTALAYTLVAAFGRKVLKTFTLSNGQTIPAGATIEIPSHAIYQDPQNYPDSETFDGFRFYKLRQQGGAINHARNQFVTTNEQNLGFGYGRHACPGRFFAANEIKMIIARLIMDYDFKNADGSTERYPNFDNGRGVSTVFDSASALWTATGVDGTDVFVDKPGSDQGAVVQEGCCLAWAEWMMSVRPRCASVYDLSDEQFTTFRIPSSTQKCSREISYSFEWVMIV